jgi:hypothetical protein
MSTNGALIFILNPSVNAMIMEIMQARKFTQIFLVYKIIAANNATFLLFMLHFVKFFNI